MINGLHNNILFEVIHYNIHHYTVYYIIDFNQRKRNFGEIAPQVQSREWLSIYSQENIVWESFIFVSLILSSCSLEYKLKEYLIDSKGYQGITSFWEYPCPRTWSIVDNCLTTCIPKVLEKVDYKACSGGCLFK